MDCQVNGAHLENDRNAHLGPKSVPALEALWRLLGGQWKDAPLFRAAGAAGPF